MYTIASLASFDHSVRLSHNLRADSLLSRLIRVWCSRTYRMDQREQTDRGLHPGTHYCPRDGHCIPRNVDDNRDRFHHGCGV